MTIETQLEALYTQTQVLDATITAELIDVTADLSSVRSRVTALEIGQGPSTGGGTGGSGGSSTGSAVEIVSAFPTVDNYAGRTVLFENKLWVYNNDVWVEVESAASTSDAPPGIVVVGSLPSAGTEGDVVFNNTDGYLYRRNNGLWVQVTVQVNTSATVADASVTVAKFASGLRPVEIFGVLPTTGNVEGRLVYLTTDDKLYRYNGTAFVNGMSTADLTGTISADQIAANAITTGKIQAGAITASQIAAEAVNAGKIAADSITSDKIVANAVTAAKIATAAITADKIEANTITAGKIAAGAIGTTQLAANAITATNIAAGAVTAGKIGAGAITATELSSGSITADKISSGVITADKIASGAITSTKISVTDLSSISSSLGSITGGSVKIGSGGNIASSGKSAPSGWTAAGSPGSYGSGSRFYVDTSGYMYGDTLAMYGHIYALTQTWRANVGSPLVHGQQEGSGVGFKSTTAGTSAFYADGGSYSPFTGSHDALVSKGITITLGDIVVDTTLVAKAGISDTIFEIATSSQPNMTAIGVFAGSSAIEPQFHVPAAMKTLSESEVASKAAGFNVARVNALGEGQVNVCGEGGNIQAGDLIVTSSLAGKGMKQADNLVRSYTVARARETVSFNPGEIKMISCIYLAG